MHKTLVITSLQAAIQDKIIDLQSHKYLTIYSLLCGLGIYII